MAKLIRITPSSTYWAVDLTPEQLTQYQSGEEGAEAVKLEVHDELMNGWWKNVSGSNDLYYIEDRPIETQDNE
jgi:hypothetical protein